jgi:hypothetical protein
VRQKLFQNIWKKLITDLTLPLGISFGKRGVEKEGEKDEMGEDTPLDDGFFLCHSFFDTK